MDIRKFNEIPNEELPKELFNLDILDGSPPCTTFSMVGEREDSWGKKKKFREGQAEQTLDDLSFIFIDTVKKLKPKVMIMENVEGLLLGEAWSYVQKIYKQLQDIGYQVKHWLCKGENMGVPQKRHRVIFIAIRQDVNYDITRLDMSFNYEPVTYGEIKDGIGEVNKESKYYYVLENAIRSDKDFSDTKERIGLGKSQFSHIYCWEDEIVPTITAKFTLYDPIEKTKLSKESLRNSQTFPQDYNFMSDVANNWCYLCGMSVPPVMIKRIVTRLIESGVFDV
jgi:DNA (cytosine-5)-methyltransferase 1